MFKARKTCSALLIGNEVLNGKTLDLNGNFLVAKTCFRTGLTLSQVRIIPDNTPEIVKHVQELSKEHDFVFTSGGIGPTHDDITYVSIAEAFHALPLQPHTSTMARMKDYYDRNGTAFTDARKRMALFPRYSKVYFASLPPWHLISDETKDKSLIQPLKPFDKLDSNHAADKLPKSYVWTPMVVVENVHILPGIPSLFSHLITSFFDHHLIPLLKQEQQYREPLFKRLFGTQMMEGDLAQHLSTAQEKFAGVSIGSYPRWSVDNPFKDPVKVVISFEGDNESEVEECVKFVQSGIPMSALGISK